MLSFPVRNSRRRRVMNEEVLSASSTHVALRARRADEAESLDAPRYSDAAGVEHHPQVTDFIPRRYGSIALLTCAGVATVAGLAALDYFADPVATAAGWAHGGLVDFAAPGNLSKWVAALVLVTAALASTLVYSLRRHRVDDFRGRYRVWLAAACACVVLSADSVVDLHNAAAQTLTHYTGWSALRGGAAWWLALAGLPLAWIGVRALVEVRECRLSAVFLSAAIGCYVVGAISFLGVIRNFDARLEMLISGTATLLGHWLLLAAVTTYARYVVLDVQGLIVHRPRAVTAKRSAGERATNRAANNGPRLAAAGTSQPARSAPAATRWVGGREREREDFGDDSNDDSVDDRKLSKSERKRLRKLKARDRAA